MEFKEPNTPEIEQKVSKESETQIFDVIHFVNYAIVGEGKDSQPSLAGLMSLNAITYLLEEGIAKNVVIGGVVYYKNAGVMVSKFYADMLRERLAKKQIDIKKSGINIIAESEISSKAEIKKGAKETGGEVDFLLSQTQKNHWNKILVIGYKPHLERIKKLYKNRGNIDVAGLNINNSSFQNNLRATFKSSEELLEQRQPGFIYEFEKSSLKKEKDDKFEKGEKTKIFFMDFIDSKGKIISSATRLLPDWLKIILQSE